MNFSELVSLASGHVEARVVQTAVELKIFDVLNGAQKSAAALAGELNLNGAATELLLNALAALKLTQKVDDSFSLAPIAKEYLVTSAPHYLGGMIRFESSTWSCWEKLDQALRSGKAVRPANMYQDDPRETETFIGAMDSLVRARGDAELLATAIDWSNVHTLLDIGSGPATYPIALCEKLPRLDVTIFDLPATLKLTDGYVNRAGMTERIRLVAGDYRADPIPGSYDVVFLSNIIHGENAERNAALVRKLAATLNNAGRLIIKDHILEDNRANPPVGAIFSLLMLLTTDGGRCYSFAEIRSWMENAGLKQIHQIGLPPPLTSSLVIGAKDA
jgi:hypothetical protein